MLAQRGESISAVACSPESVRLTVKPFAAGLFARSTFRTRLVPQRPARNRAFFWAQRRGAGATCRPTRCAGCFYSRKRRRRHVWTHSSGYWCTSIPPPPFLHCSYKVDQVAGARSSPHVAYSWASGPGQPGWNSSLGISANVATRFGTEEYFDVVFLDGHALGIAPEHLAPGVVRAFRKHECREEEACAELMEKLEPSIVVLVNPFEVAQNPELYNVSRRMLLAHVPSPFPYARMNRREPSDRLTCCY